MHTTCHTYSTESGARHKKVAGYFNETKVVGSLKGLRFQSVSSPRRPRTDYHAPLPSAFSLEGTSVDWDVVYPDSQPELTSDLSDDDAALISKLCFDRLQLLVN